ncbi:MAG: hypothetical protein HFP81_08535 [Methylococcales symbiont of Hymedesmia sp. n. MRB-2018]|nr:MAG: hypothetical protein HFP78_08765 [Methylococcales symbiont of Hymedesmia sp. n. MRB-2018]KAF3983218.1 MAG: hypothetical protein HFP81_08535 [Methylococcales symbiont of Hymedesmia sp. n. MRB-2018]
MFIYSLPILFSHIQIGSPIELLSIVLVLTTVLYIVTVFDPSYVGEGGPLFGLSLYRYLLYAWIGHLKLWVVFWPFFILLNISLFITDWLATGGKFTVSSWDEVHFVLATPIVFWTIIVWRNSINTHLPLTGALARLMVLLVYFEFALKLLIRKDYPRIFFACQDILLDYAACF